MTTEDPIISSNLPYQDQDVPLNGLLCWSPGAREPQPGLLLIHGGAGLDEHARTQARRYAELGYAVLAADMYGEGVAGDRAAVMTALTALRDDPDFIVRRARAGFDVLTRCSHTNGPVAAIGFCFGGMAALALARASAPVAGVISMHGTLSTTRPAEPGSVTAKVLVCHGADDPHVPLDDVVAFADEMKLAGADWRLIMYGGAEHGFTHQHAQPGAQPGVSYHALTDQRSFADATGFLRETLSSQSSPYEAT